MTSPFAPPPSGQEPTPASWQPGQAAPGAWPPAGATGWSSPGAHHAPATAPSESGAGRRSPRRRRGLAVAVAVVGVVTGAALWVAASMRYDDAVSSLARAPIGCDTTLDFDEPGDYLVFVETAGTLPEVSGDCGRTGEFDLGDDRAPGVEVRVVDPDGDELTLLSRRDRESYDRAGSRGTSLARLTIDEPGDHVLRATSASDEPFAVAVGTDPSAGVGALRLAGVVAALVGIVGAIVVMLTGRRSSAAPVEARPVPAPMAAYGAPPATGPPPMHVPTGPPAASPPWQPTAPSVPGPPPGGGPGTDATFRPPTDDSWAQPSPDGSDGTGPAWSPIEPDQPRDQ